MALAQNFKIVLISYLVKTPFEMKVLYFVGLFNFSKDNKCSITSDVKKKRKIVFE